MDKFGHLATSLFSSGGGRKTSGGGGALPAAVRAAAAAKARVAAKAGGLRMPKFHRDDKVLVWIGVRQC